jgi:hypothetical protein
MAQVLRIEDVIEKETYVDRHGIVHPNKVDGKSIYFVNRVEDMFLDVLYEHYGTNINKEEFLQSYKTINDLITQLPRGISKDSFRKNWIWNSRGNVVAIDFGTLRLLPSQIELVNILEGCKDSVSEEEIKRLMQEYVNLRRRSGDETIEHEAFQRGYSTCAVQRHLELVGYNELGYLDPPLGVQDRAAENTWQIQKASYNLDKARRYYPETEQSCRILDAHLKELEKKLLN